MSQLKVRMVPIEGTILGCHDLEQVPSATYAWWLFLASFSFLSPLLHPTLAMLVTVGI